MTSGTLGPVASLAATPTGAAARRAVNWLVVGVGDVAIKRVLPALAREPRSTIFGVVSRDAAKGAARAPLSWAEACGMEQIARREGRLLGVAYFRRYYPKLMRARELLAQGVVGEPVMAVACCSEWVPDFDAERSWLLDPERAGSGPLYDIGSHRIDALNFLLGEPVRVSAQLNTAVRSFAVEDGASVLMEYPGGARALLDARWNTRAQLDDFRIVGTEGVLELGPLNGPTLRYGDREECLPCDDNRHYPCIAAFVDSILQDKPLECSADRVRATARVLDFATREWRQAWRSSKALR